MWAHGSRCRSSPPLCSRVRALGARAVRRPRAPASWPHPNRSSRRQRSRTPIHSGTAPAQRRGGGRCLPRFSDTAAGLVSRRRASFTARQPRDGRAPVSCRARRSGERGLAFAIAMKVRDLHAAESAVGAWDAGARRSVAGMALRVHSPGQRSETATALSPSGYLVVASSEADSATLGVYAATTLPSKPLRSRRSRFARPPARSPRRGSRRRTSAPASCRACSDLRDEPSRPCSTRVRSSRASILSSLRTRRCSPISRRPSSTSKREDGENTHAVARLTPKGGRQRRAQAPRLDPTGVRSAAARCARGCQLRDLGER